MKKTTPRMLLAIALFVAAHGAAVCQLNGHNFRGDWGVQAATQPPPGWQLSLMTFGYDGDTLRDRNGDEILEVQGDIRVRGVSPSVWWVSNARVLGANYSVMIAPTLVNDALEAPVLELSEETGLGRGDLYVQPINLGWHTRRLDTMAGLGVFAPTGRYELGADDNTGLGMWSFELFGGLTAYFDQRQTWHFSALASWQTHTEKEESDIQVGDQLTVEGGIGKSLRQEAIIVGASYVAQWKLTDDVLPEIIPPEWLGRHQVFALGPELTLALFATTRVAGNINLRYMTDIVARSTSEGDTFLVSLDFEL